MVKHKHIWPLKMEADVSWETPATLYHNSLPPTLSWVRSIQSMTPSHFFKLHGNSIHSSTPRSSNFFLFLAFPHDIYPTHLKFIEQIHSWEFCSHSAAQTTPRFSWSPFDHCRLHNSILLITSENYFTFFLPLPA